jgi:transposase
VFCSRSSVYRVLKAYRAGTLTFEDPAEEDTSRIRLRILTPSRKRSVLVILKTMPRACGWCRTRWSCATLALEVQARRGVHVSAETLRRWLHELGWVWKRAKLTAKDNDPQRVTKRARLRYVVESLQVGTALFFADELDICLLPKVGSQGMPKGEQVAVPTPGTTEKRYVAGALDITTGPTPHGVWWRQTTGLFVDLLATLDRTYPAREFASLYLVVDNSKIHKAREVEKWLAAHPRFTLLFLPTYCPKANPIERTFGDVHDKCTRNPTRKRMGHLVQDVEQQLQVNGPWPYTLSDIYYTPEVSAALQALIATGIAREEISQLAA